MKIYDLIQVEYFGNDLRKRKYPAIILEDKVPHTLTRSLAFGDGILFYLPTLDRIKFGFRGEDNAYHIYGPGAKVNFI